MTTKERRRPALRPGRQTDQTVISRRICVSKKTKPVNQETEINILVSAIDNIMLAVDNMNDNAATMINLFENTNRQIINARNSLSSKISNIPENPTIKLTFSDDDKKIFNQNLLDMIKTHTQRAFDEAAEQVVNKEMRVHWSIENESISRLIQNTEDKIDRLVNELKILNAILK
jgi:propanediol dehydratase large subunit